jgi:hypothetical protein
MPKYDLKVEFDTLFMDLDKAARWEGYLALGTDTSTGELVVAAADQDIYRGYSLREAQSVWDAFTQDHIVDDFMRRSLRGKSWPMIFREQMLENRELQVRMRERTERRERRIRDRQEHYITQLVLSGQLTQD